MTPTLLLLKQLLDIEYSFCLSKVNKVPQYTPTRKRYPIKTTYVEAALRYTKNWTAPGNDDQIYKPRY